MPVNPPNARFVAKSHRKNSKPNLNTMEIIEQEKLLETVNEILYTYIWIANVLRPGFLPPTFHCVRCRSCEDS